jgi:hypothetical protein
MRPLGLLRSFTFSVLVVILIWDALLWLTGKYPVWLVPHRQLLMTGFLIWFIAVLFDRNRDDDWAGQL